MNPSSQARLARLVNLPLSRCIIDHLVDATIDVVNHGLGHRSSPQRGRLPNRNNSNFKFRHFVHSVLHRAQCMVPTLLAAAIYIARAKPFITIAKSEWAFERVFLGALVCATKYHNDTSLKNPQWALATGIFSPRDISRIEREFLDVLDFQLRVTETDLLSLERPFISAFFSPKPRVAYTPPSSSDYQQRDDEDGEEEEDSSSRWSDSDEDEDDATTDFTSSPSGSDRSISTKSPSTALGSFPLPPASSTTKIVVSQPTRHPSPPARSQIPLSLSV
ncbi:hypothetical protein BDM02DRAFT_2386955 [Thelephora ganbajun]|uniref:Uncharacterized protein n=1 Tax=Thelephora ganbajun TaxID=370292 RepID=A0ACB6ZTT7_THEGA|nr:hypothetical protein BDM02DRAFT_2386955 [Thelephora ganbajun]